MSYGAACPRCAPSSYMHTCMPGKDADMLYSRLDLCQASAYGRPPRYACFCFVGGSDDVLSKVLTTLIEFKALLPALMMISNPFQSASSLTSKQAEAQAYNFKARLLHYYFSIPPQPGLQLPQLQADQKCHCMVSRLPLNSKLIEAAQILPKASAQARTLLALTVKPRNAQLHTCPCAVGRLRFGYN